VGPKQQRRRSAEESRRRLLDAGRQLAHEQPAGLPLANVRLTEVADRAGVTIGAFYHYWDTQDAYRLDLLRHLLDSDRFDTSADAATLVGPLVDAGVALTEVIRQAADHNFETLRDLPDQRVSMALWAQDEAESIRLLRSMYGAIDRSWTALYASVLAAYGREPRPPFDIGTIAVALTALFDGLLVRHGLDPHRVEAPIGTPADGDTAAWSLVAAVIVGLLPTLTRPIEGDEAERADLWTTVERLLGPEGPGIRAAR
jgi:AcrR family transcriptional regulator